MATQRTFFGYFVPFVVGVLCVEVKVDLLPYEADCVICAKKIVNSVPCVIPVGW